MRAHGQFLEEFNWCQGVWQFSAVSAKCAWSAFVHALRRQAAQQPGVVGYEGGIYFRCKWRAKLRRNAVVPGTACHVGRQKLGLAMWGGIWVCWGAGLAMCECFSDPQYYECGVGRWEALHLGLCPLKDKVLARPVYCCRL